MQQSKNLAIAFLLGAVVVGLPETRSPKAERHPLVHEAKALLSEPDFVRYAFAGGAGYMFPRNDGILLGGTFERGEWDATPQPADIRRIMRSHRRLFAGFRCMA